jgi:hypothetical protein
MPGATGGTRFPRDLGQCSTTPLKIRPNGGSRRSRFLRRTSGSVAGACEQIRCLRRGERPSGVRVSVGMGRSGTFEVCGWDCAHVPSPLVKASITPLVQSSGSTEPTPLVTRQGIHCTHGFVAKNQQRSVCGAALTFTVQPHKESAQQPRTRNPRKQPAQVIRASSPRKQSARSADVPM